MEKFIYREIYIATCHSYKLVSIPNIRHSANKIDI